MWYIKNAQGEIIYLKPNKLMTVSRKEENDIVLKNDASISKLHATITIRPKVNFKNNEPSSVVIVQDTGSKYGTFVINNRNQQCKLPPGNHELTATDKIKFGLLHHIFTLHYVPLITSTSTLNSNEKAELRNIIDSVEGVIVEEWKEYCTHLTVSNVTLTHQVAHALAFGTLIVKLEYWRAVELSVIKNEPLPDIADFIPTINEGSINKENVSLKANTERKVLFKNLVFVCFSTSQYSLKDIIKCAGGRLKLFKEGVFDPKQLLSENIILLQVADDTLQISETFVNLYDSIQRSLQQKKLRLIPESEIFLAILYCSVEKYCNPKFDFRKLIRSSKRNQSGNALSSMILAQDTQDILPTTKKLRNVIINETLTPSEQANERQTENVMKSKLSLGRKQTVGNLKDSTQSAVGNKKILEKQTFGSEESSRDGVLMIDETRSSFESDSNDSSIEKCDIVNEFDESVDKLKISASESTNRRFNLCSKLPTARVSQKQITEKSETQAQTSNRNSAAYFYFDPSTSKKSHNLESTNNSSEREENLTRKRVKNTLDQRSKEKIHQEESIFETKADVMKVRKASSSSNVSQDRKFPKRTRIDEEEDMFSFVNERATKKKKTSREHDGVDSFELLEDTNPEDFHKEENIFAKELSTVERYQNKRRRSSLSSHDSSIEEEKPDIKIERIDSEDETDHAPLIRYKKELDSGMDETCKSSIIPLLRTDINLTLGSNSTGYPKTFVKIYTIIPQQRIKLKDMYVWKSQEETMQYKPCEEELNSSENDDEDFKIFNTDAPKKKRRK